MKKIVVFMILLTTLLTVSKMTYATSTLSLEKTVGGNGASWDYAQNKSNTGDIDAYLINFTYTEKFKIDIDYESGEFMYFSGSPTLEWWDIQVGYSIINHPKWLVYVTVGGMTYSEYSRSDLTPKHDANGCMWGVDLVGIPTERFQYELNLQYSFSGGSSRSYYNNYLSGNSFYDSSPDLTIYKIKIRYFFTDNFGLSVNYRSMDYININPRFDAAGIGTTSIGLIYRF